MSIKSKIHDIWAADSALITLIPESRVITGRVPKGTPMPYASVETPELSKDEETSTSLIVEGDLKFTVWAPTDTVGGPIVSAILDAFNNEKFEAGEGWTVLNISQPSVAETQPDEDPNNRYWQYVITFRLLATRSRVH